MLLVLFGFVFFFFKQKTAYEMRISDWSSDVCSSDLGTHDARQEDGRGKASFPARPGHRRNLPCPRCRAGQRRRLPRPDNHAGLIAPPSPLAACRLAILVERAGRLGGFRLRPEKHRLEAHTSALQSLMRTSYAVFCLQQNKSTHSQPPPTHAHLHY